MTLEAGAIRGLAGLRNVEGNEREARQQVAPAGR